MKKIIETYKHKVFFCGGCVRDELTGHKPTDYDFVIEQVTPETFESDFPEHKRVGKDFPVYIVDGNEVALARVEIKTGEKYQDYKVEAGRTIYEDLFRRDFSFNSLAKSVIDGTIVDPFDGISDIKQKQLKCVNPLAFKEDPLRIIRGCRFVGRFNLVIEKKTKNLMKENIKEIRNITKERITLELEKSYKQLDYPSDFIRTLNTIGALIGPFEIFAKMNERFAGPDKYHGRNSILDHTLDVFDSAKRNGYNFSVGMACLLHDCGKTQTPDNIYNPKRQHIGHDFRGGDIIDEILDKFRFDNYTNNLIRKSVKHHMAFHELQRMKPVSLIRLYEKIGKLFFDDVVKVGNCDHELNFEQWTIINKIKATFATKVVVPDNIKGGEKIKQFVENFRVKIYKQL